jgi:hypothetical protein
MEHRVGVGFVKDLLGLVGHHDAGTRHGSAEKSGHVSAYLVRINVNGPYQFYVPSFLLVEHGACRRLPDGTETVLNNAKRGGHFLKRRLAKESVVESVYPGRRIAP